MKEKKFIRQGMEVALMLELLRFQNNLNIRIPYNLNLMKNKIMAISLQLKVERKQTLY